MKVRQQAKTVMFPRDVEEELLKRSAQNGVPFNRLVVNACRDYLSAPSATSYSTKQIEFVLKRAIDMLKKVAGETKN